MPLRVAVSEIEALQTLRLAMGEEFICAVPGAALCSFISALRRNSYRKGEVVYHEDDERGLIYIVAEGWVKHCQVTPAGAEFTHWISAQGDFFGALAGNQAVGRAATLTNCTLLTVDRSHFFDLLATVESPSEFLMERYAAGSSTLLNAIHDLAFFSVPKRLSNVLLKFSRQPPESPEHLRVVPDFLTQTELAQLVGSSRESVNQWLKYFANQAWIELRGRRIILLDEDALRHKPQ